MLKVLVTLLISYCLGSISGAYLTTKYTIGKDIRAFGSGNAGARNAGRVAGKKAFVITILIDVGKVLIALLISSILFPENNWILLSSSLFLLIGHNWPVFLSFKGGKGVVVFLTSSFMISPIGVVAAAICFSVIYLFRRDFTVAGLIAMIAIPIPAWINGLYVDAIGLFILLLIVILSHLKWRIE